MPSNPQTATTLTRQDLEDILHGAAILACGGGGPVGIGRDIIDYFDKNNLQVQLVDPKAVDAKAWMCVSAFIGSPNAAADALTPQSISDAANAAFDALQKTTGAAYRYVMPGEVGAGNSFVPMTVAVKKGILVVDVDGAGRAIPSLTQVTYAAQNVPIAPMVLANTENVVTVGVQSVSLAEAIAREVVSAADFGQDGGIAFWSMTGSTMRKAAIHNTMSYARELGKQLREAIASQQDPVAVVVNYLTGGCILFTGKINSVTEVTSGGFDTGQLSIKNQAGEELIIYNVNENLMAWNTRAKAPLILAPDMISFMATDGTVFTNASSDLQTVQGKEVVVIGSQARPQMRSDYIIQAFMTVLRQMGYGGAYFKFK